MKFHGLPNYFLKKQKQNSLLLFQALLWFASPLTNINGLCGGSGINSLQSHFFWKILNFYSLNIPRAKDFFFLLHGTHAKTLSSATRAVNNYQLSVNGIQILQILPDLRGSEHMCTGQSSWDANHKAWAPSYRLSKAARKDNHCTEIQLFIP